MIISFTDSEIDWLIATCPADEYGEDWRAQLLANRIKMRREDEPRTHMCVMDLTLERLWQIDAAIMLNSPFGSYLIDPTQPLLYLSDKIWRAIVVLMGLLEEESANDSSYQEAFEEANRRATEGE